MASAILRALRGLKAPKLTGGFLLRTVVIVMMYLGKLLPRSCLPVAAMSAANFALTREI